MVTQADRVGQHVEADRAALQAGAIRTLVLSQVLSGLGMASGIAVGALLAQQLSGSDALAGLGTTFQVLGGALIAIPVARVMAARGRRPGLQLGYLLAFVGAAIVVSAAVADSFPLMLVGMLLFGGGTSANGQARYAAADLALPARRGRDLSIVVWATTIGSVIGPNLVGPGKAFAQAVGLPDLAGSFVFSLAGFLLAWIVINRLLRPDPLLTSRALERAGRAAAAQRPPEPSRDVTDAARPEPADPSGPLEPDAAASLDAADDADDHDGSLSRGLRVVRANPMARLGMITVALGHLVMVSVMVMTPLHMSHGNAELEVIGFVISMHIVGMYAFSPLVGAAVDRWGGRRVASTGGVILAAAGLLASRAHTGWSGLLLVALVLLGLGWSCTLVSGSTLLTASVTASERPAVQGLSEVVMGLAGAGGGALAGVVVGGFGYPTLAAAAAVVGVGVVVLATTTHRDRSTVPTAS
ncbi:MFS transporter [Humibacillus sp. DSM 29435]|uniref:MFS transporter n=1 Tax=Humibacillus sp. DSM 29435 TaxID=1869167 RepID=UPI000872347D|nr:MFS transporter [Humibacillus sp. DSM 29435]OFE18422.1 MFS transporter [Humibacillus sp. DSM 29435]